MISGPKKKNTKFVFFEIDSCNIKTKIIFFETNLC